MKTLEYVVENYQRKCLGWQDVTRIGMFLENKDLEKLELEIKEGQEGERKVVPFTKEVVLSQLKKDVEYALECLENKKRYQASIMYSVIKMWNWILEDGLENVDNYGERTDFGRPLIEQTAKHYGWEFVKNV